MLRFPWAQSSGTWSRAVATTTRRHHTAASVSPVLQNSTGLSAPPWRRVALIALRRLPRVLFLSLTATVTSYHHQLVCFFVLPLGSRKPLLITMFCCNIDNTVTATTTGTGTTPGPTTAANSSVSWQTYTPVRTQSAPIPSASAATLNRTSILAVLAEIVCIGVLINLLMWDVANGWKGRWIRWSMDEMIDGWDGWRMRMVFHCTCLCLYLYCIV